MLLEISFTILMMIIAMINDIKSNTIKNIIPLTGIFIGIITSLFINKQNLLIVIFTCVLYFLLLYYLPKKNNINEFMGAGDIKLFFAITFLMGFYFSIYTLLYSIFAGCIGLILLNIKRIKQIFFNTLLFFNLSKDNRKGLTKVIDSQVPNIYSVYILIGVIITYIQLYYFNNNWLFDNITKNISLLFN